MANTLTNLIPDAYAALNVVSRELVGIIPAVTRDARVERAAVGQTVRSHVVPAATSSNITPGVTPPDDGDQTIGNVDITISKAKRAPFRWNGEEQRGLNNGGAGVLSIMQDQIAQAMRVLVNEIEADLAALYVDAGAAYGTTTTPFGTANDYTDASQTLKLLLDAGTPNNDLHLILNTSAGANLRGKQSTPGNTLEQNMLRQGVLLDVNGFAIRESAQIKRPTSGTGASGTTNNAGYAVGATVITLASAGTGTILAGDTVVFTGDTTKYVVATGGGDADISGGGTITLNAPGLKQAIPASATNITVTATTARNMAFRRSAIVLAQRLPALPDGGDLAVDRATIVDPVSGLALELAMYPQYRQMQYEVSCAWGQRVVKKEHLALLLGGG